MTKVLEIDWLDACPKCDCSEHKVHTEEGSKEWLYSGDVVECGECGHIGTIDADGESAWVDWFKVEATQGDGDE